MKTHLLIQPGNFLLFAAIFIFSTTAFAAPPMVRVQPNGSTFASAYTLQNETRTFFGNVMEGSPPYQAKWTFSDGAATPFTPVGDPWYIATDHVFASSGTHWAQLTVQDNVGASESATINLLVISSAADTLQRKKNSAIDRGLRATYLLEQKSMDGSWWPGGNGNQIAATGMALIALENHGHNLESADSDIYKMLVEEGIRYILNNAFDVNLTVQPCIGDPENNDGDLEHDGKGVVFSGSGSGEWSGWDEGYANPIAALALVNSSELTTAQTTVVNTIDPGRFVNGQTLFSVALDSKDFIAFAQNDGLSEQYGMDSWNDLTGGRIHVEGLMGTVQYLELEFNPPSGNIPNCPGSFSIDWGDGGAFEEFAVEEESCPDWIYTYSGNQIHSYPADGEYIITAYYNDGQTVTEIVSVEVSISGVGGEGTAECLGNGWRYERNAWDADNSVTQWPVLALEELNSRWGIGVNPEVKVQLDGWLNYSQDGSGGFGYSAPSDWNNFAKTGAGLAMLHYIGLAPGSARMDNALGYLSSQWSTFGGENGNLGNFYAMYAFFKGMKYLKLNFLDSLVWEDLYTQYITTNQLTNGQWSDNGNWYDDEFSTYSALAILAPAISGLPPVANAGGPYPDAAPKQIVMLDGTGSFHQDPTKNIAKWEWDFDDEDGLWWETKSAPDPGEGVLGETAAASFPDIGNEKTYIVTLQVTDNSVPEQLKDTDTAEIKVATGNVPPVAVTNGPWTGLPNEEIIFNGSASYDPNSCMDPSNPSCLGDKIETYEWDLDGDGAFNEANGDDGLPTSADWSVVKRSFPEPLSRSAFLRVTDSFGLSNVSSAQFNIISIAIVFGQNYETCFRNRETRFVERRGLSILFKNFGDGAAEKLTMTLIDVPSNISILEGSSSLGDLAPNQEKTTACDSAAATADIEIRFDRKIVPVGEWKWRAEFDLAGKHYVVDNIPPLGP